MTDKELFIQILRHSKEKPVFLLKELEELSSKSKVESLLRKLERRGMVFQPTIDGNFQITPKQRAKIAIIGAVEGLDFERIVRELTWQEFEILTAIVGEEFGYIAKRGLVFSTSERRYQIDIVLENHPYILLIDCKHFGGTGKKTLLKNAAMEQKIRTEAASRVLNELREKLALNAWNKAVLIPMLVTWLDDSLFFHENVPIVPFMKLRSFFREFYLYFEDILQFQVELL